MNGIRKLIAVVAVATAAIAGSPFGASAQAQADQPTSEERAPRSTALHVSNYNLLDVNVFVAIGGMPIRLGTVTSFGSADFVLPPGATVGTGMQLIADPIGQAASFTTERFNVMPGQKVDWTIENNLFGSSVWVS